MKKLILVVFISLYAQQVLSSGYETFSPSFVGCISTGICYIGIEPEATNTTCQNKAQIRFDITTPGSTPQYSSALSALMADKQIGAYITDACIDGYPGVKWLHITK